jgi:hypothetical protein
MVHYRVLWHAANLRHGANGFTFLQKEGVLRIFLPKKILWLWPGTNLQSWVPEASMLTTRPPKPLLRIRTNGRLLWTWRWILGFHKMHVTCENYFSSFWQMLYFLNHNTHILCSLLKILYGLLLWLVVRRTIKYFFCKFAFWNIGTSCVWNVRWQH